MAERGETLKVTTKAVTVTVEGEPIVIHTFRGYAPAMNVKVDGEEGIKALFISAKTLSDELVKFVEANGGKFHGIRFTVRKESDDKMAKYLVEKA